MALEDAQYERVNVPPGENDPPRANDPRARSADDSHVYSSRARVAHASARRTRATDDRFVGVSRLVRVS